MRMILNLKQGTQKALFFVFFLLCSTVMVAQNKVSGTVQDATGEPLIGVSILEVGTNNGTVTDIDGKFSLTVNRGAKISFSYVGYTPQTLVATLRLGEGYKSVEHRLGTARKVMRQYMRQYA